MKRVIMVLMALCLLGVTTISTIACSRDRTNGEEPINTSMTQLYVSNFDGGFGSQWLEDVADAFENANATTSFEKGKTGVQVRIDKNKDKGNQLNFNTTNNEVFFCEEVSYFNFASQGALLDISDVVEYVCNQEGVSLYPKMETGLKYNEKYFALPHYETAFGIVYDKDLFHNKKLYIAKNGDYVNSDGDLSVGPDGEPGSYDDGLPSTMQEFFDLCDYMKDLQGVTPFIITGESASRYSANLVNRIATAYDGQEITEARYTFDADNISVIKNGTLKADSANVLGYTYETETVDKISNNNGYLLQHTPGKLYGLAFLEKMLEENGQRYFDTTNLSGTMTHLNAQENYINSSLKGAPVAMLLDGLWWENEATSNEAFSRSEQVYGTSGKKENRNFGIMPIPVKIDDNDTNSNGNPNTAIDMYSAYAFISAKIAPEKIKAAKEFLKFCYSAENLEKFTASTGVARAMTYNISETTYKNMTSYSKDVWDMHLSGSIVSQVSDNSLFYENESSFNSLSLLAYGNYTYPWSAFRGGTVSAMDYFKGTCKWDAQSWETTYGGYFS